MESQPQNPEFRNIHENFHLYIISFSEKLPVSISIFWKIYNTALCLPLRPYFWSTTYWFGYIKQLYEPWNYGTRDALAFHVFRSFFFF